MTQHSDIDRILSDWLDDGPTRMPDRVVDIVADRIGRQRQRHAWRLLRRFPVRSIQLAAGLAAVLVIAVAGWSLLSRPPGIGNSPSPILTIGPTSSPAPTTTAFACDDGTSGCLGALAAGTYSSANFRPLLTYTIPTAAGGAPWSNSSDLSRSYTLVPPGAGYSFQVLSEVAIPEQDATCATQAKDGVGSTVNDWVTFFTKHPGLDAKAPVPVTIGGFSGFRIDFARAASWTARCPGSVGPAILTVMHPGHEGVLWVDDQQESYWILDVAGETVLIHVDSAPDPAAHVADLAKAQPIIDSFGFTPR